MIGPTMMVLSVFVITLIIFFKRSVRPVSWTALGLLVVNGLAGYYIASRIEAGL
jgi:hypothetical protein